MKRAAENWSAAEIEVPPSVSWRGVAAMKKDIEARSIPHEQLVGQTITLSNFGMFGGRFADLVVVPPQVAILGAGRAEARVVAVDRPNTIGAQAGGVARVIDEAAVGVALDLVAKQSILVGADPEQAG